MEDSTNKLKQTPEKLPKKYLVPVKSRYLDFSKKSSSQSDNSGPSKPALKTSSDHHNPRRPVWNNSTFLGTGTKAANTKTSTPTKDISLFAADVSAVASGIDFEAQKGKLDDPAKLSEKALDEYNTALLLRAVNVLIRKQQAEFSESADKELSVLRNAVEDSAATLSKLHHQIDVTVSLDELQEDLTIGSNVVNELVGDPIFSDPSSFKDVTAELEENLNQLPCKNVRIPSNQKDLDDIETLAAKCVKKLSCFSLKHEENIKLASEIKKESCKTESFLSNIRETNSSVQKVIPIATTKVLDQTSQDIMNSVLANTEIKF